MIIQDGSGSGYKARVTSDKLLRTLSVRESLEYFINSVYSSSYSLVFQQTSGGADNIIYYLKNSDARDLVLEGIWLRTESSEGIEISLGNSGTPTSGSNIIPVNLNAASGNKADVVSLEGSNIGGLTTGNLAYRYFLNGNNETVWFNFNQDIILPLNTVLTISCITGNIQVDGILEFFFVSPAGVNF